MKHAPRRHRTKPASGPSLLERIKSERRRHRLRVRGRIMSPFPPTVTRPPCARSRPSRRSSTASPTGSTACGITTVAMESTGVYWIPLYEILEARGLDMVLVNARHVGLRSGAPSG